MERDWWTDWKTMQKSTNYITSSPTLITTPLNTSKSKVLLRQNLDLLKIRWRQFKCLNVGGKGTLKTTMGLLWCSVLSTDLLLIVLSMKISEKLKELRSSISSSNKYKLRLCLDSLLLLKSLLTSLKFLVLLMLVGLKNSKREVDKMTKEVLKTSVKKFFRNFLNTKTLGLSVKELIDLKFRIIMK